MEVRDVKNFEGPSVGLQKKEGIFYNFNLEVRDVKNFEGGRIGLQFEKVEIIILW